MPLANEKGSLHVGYQDNTLYRPALSEHLKIFGNQQELREIFSYLWIMLKVIYIFLMRMAFIKYYQINTSHFAGVFTLVLPVRQGLIVKYNLGYENWGN